MFLPAAEPIAKRAAAGLSGEIASALLRGGTVLTPNPRTARTLLLHYDRMQQAAGAQTWQAPDILSWHAWTGSMWRNAIVSGVDHRVLLNAQQERELWRRVIEGGQLETLRPTASQARLCETAMDLLGAYDVSGRFARGTYPMHALSADADSFAGWYARFEERCRTDALLPASHLMIELAEHVQQGRIPLAAEYVLYGFGALTPADKLLIAAMQQAGSSVRHIAADVTPTLSPMLRCAPSGHAEIQQCARWVREQLDRNADASVAVVVPDLPAVHGALQRELRRAVAPQMSDVTAGEQAPLYEFSSGRALDGLPMVQDALRVLRWCAGPLSLEDAGALLRSPNLCLAESQSRGAELDMHVVRAMPALRGEVSMRDVTVAITGRKSATPNDTAGLRKLQSAARSLGRERDSYAAFADDSRGVLRAAGWPGADPLNSVEHQALDRWEEALDGVATLDLLGSRTTFDGFVAAVESTAREMAFAAENTGAPVQVMNVREVEGSTVDALWFLHADENTWPAKQRMHPLLPWTLQRELRMPGVDTHADEDADRATLQRLLRSAGEVVFSYSSTTASGTQRPSSLVAEITGAGVAIGDFAEEDTPSLMEMHEDAEPLPPLPQGVISGGASVLQAQAQCAFRAFAEKRLFAAPVDPRDSGYTAMERGDQVHKVLQKFWEKVRSRDELIRISKRPADGTGTERDALLRQYIGEMFAAKQDESWDAAYIEVQRQRLFKLLNLWLDFEMTRPPFTVEAIELEVPSAELGPLHLKLRVDRIDRVEADGVSGTLLIDYKTGPARAQDWQGDRPDQPQLPVYAVAGGLGQVDGLAFGAVRVGNNGMKFEGRARDRKLLSHTHGGSKEPFEVKLENWQRDLTRLAEDFAAGDASVDPKQYPKTCDRCAQRMLCRVDAALLLEIDDQLDDEDEGGMPWG